MISDMPASKKSPLHEQVLKIRYESKNALQDAIVQNLSSSGFFVPTEAPFDIGHKFRIEIDLPKNKTWIKGMCEVVWVNQMGTKNYPKWIYEAQILKDIASHQLYNGMRIRFVEMLPKYKKRIQECLHAIGKSANPHRARTSKRRRSRSRAKEEPLRASGVQIMGVPRY